MEDSSRNLTTFVCPFGRFRFQRMPFGLKYAAAVYQGLMEKVLSSCKDFSALYIVIFSNSWSEHLCHVRKFSHALRQAGLTAKASEIS